MSEQNNQNMYPRTEADIAAEQQATEIAATGSWEQQSQPGFEQSAGHIALQATAELVPAEPVTEQAEPIFGFESRESGLLIPSKGTKSSVDVLGGNDEVLVTDKRRITLAGVETAHQEKMEALRKPLTNNEIAQSSYNLSSKISKQIGNAKLESGTDKEIKDLEGDQRALSRIQQLFSGQAIQRGNDPANKYKKMSLEARLDDLIAEHDSDRIVNYTTQEVHAGGYGGTLYYEFARAKDLLAKIQSHPVETRQQLLGKELLEGDFADSLKQPLKLSQERSDLVRA